MEDCDITLCTVGDLIEHLQKNFKPTDKLCYWYEGGAYMNCEHILKEELGHNKFMYVSDDKKRLSEKYPDNDMYKDCSWIKDNDVIIV
jgi:hypothetical protein